MKHTQKISLCAAALGLLVAETSAIAQARTRIADLQKPRTATTISGRVIGFGEADENEWIIDDGSGQVRVDGGSRKKRNINLSKGETIVVVGEMDEDEFDAFSITRSDGSTINIRSPKRRQHSDDHDDDDR